MPTAVHSGPGTSHSGCTQTAGPPTLAVLGPAVETVAVAAAAVVAVEVVRESAFRRAVATSVIELLELVAVPHSESGAVTEMGATAGAAEQRVAAAVGPGAGAGREIGSVLAAGEPLAVEAVLIEESRMLSGCSGPDKAARTPSGAGVGVVGPVGLVAMEAALGVETALGVAALSKRNCEPRQHGDLDAVAVHMQLGDSDKHHILPGRKRLGTDRPAADQHVDHSPVLAVPVSAILHVGT